LTKFAEDQLADAPANDLACPQLGYLWRWFEQLIDCREVGFGAGPLTYQEIDAWARLMRFDVSPVEATLLRQLDRTYRTLLQEKLERDKPKPKSISDKLEDIRLANEAQKALDAERAQRRKQNG